MITTKFNNDYSIDNKDKEAIEHILSDYKRVLEMNEALLKENEILKDEKNEAWKEWNDLEQGSYEVEERLKKENEKIKETNDYWKSRYCKVSNDNNILIQKIKDKIEELKKEKEEYYSQYKIDELNDKIQVLQELLESEE